jgi:hypothetical protein
MPGRMKDSAPKPARTTRRQYTSEAKVEILAEYDTPDRNDRGTLLRAALAANPGRQPANSVERKNGRMRTPVQRLETDLGLASKVINLQATFLVGFAELPADNVDRGTGMGLPPRLEHHDQGPRSAIAWA